MINHPDSSKLLFLIGMPAVGKTYWGAEIGQAYNIRFIDLDSFIEERSGATIAALFADHGADAFRNMEHEYLKALIEAPRIPAIIACGGGTPCYYNNLDLMKNAGTVIYLAADVPYLMRNLENSGAQRPLLENIDDIKTGLEDLLARREHYYEQAHHILQTKDISITTFAEIISSCINRP